MKATKILLVLFVVALASSCRYPKKCAAYDGLETDQTEESVEVID